MRHPAVLLTLVCLAACSATPPAQSEQALVRNSGWRRQQVALDAAAIMEGMARAQALAVQPGARTAR